MRVRYCPEESIWVDIDNPVIENGSPVVDDGVTMCHEVELDDINAELARLRAEVELLGGFEERILELGGCNATVQVGEQRRMTPKEIVDNFKARKYSAGYNAGIRDDITQLQADAEAGRRLPLTADKKRRWIGDTVYGYVDMVAVELKVVLRPNGEFMGRCGFVKECPSTLYAPATVLISECYSTLEALRAAEKESEADE
jgi:hypothetical protein